MQLIDSFRFDFKGTNKDTVLLVLVGRMSCMDCIFRRGGIRSTCTYAYQRMGRKKGELEPTHMMKSMQEDGARTECFFIGQHLEQDLHPGRSACHRHDG